MTGFPIKWTQEKDDFLKINYGKIPLKEISEKVGQSTETIRYRAKKLGCKPYVQGFLMRGKNRRYSLDMSFFDNPNLLNCYWAGFLAADGCVKSKRREVVVALSAKDRSHLEKFVKDCNFSGPIKEIKAHISKPVNGKKIKSGPSVRLEFYGVDKWIESLKNNFNIIDRKSLILKSPNITDISLSLAYIAGYLDGDGFITYNKNKNVTNFGFRGTKNVLNWIKKVLDKIEPYTGSMTGREPNVQNYDGYPVYIVCGQRSLKILLKLQSFNLPKIERKWNKINEIKK